jgi:putative ABC transport system permease protein
MFGYYVKLALLSIKRTPVLSALMVIAIAMGIGASMTTITVNYLMSADPIAHKSNQLFHVQLDSWDPNTAYNDEEEPPVQITWTEAINLMAAKQAVRQTAISISSGVIEPVEKSAKPFLSSIRLNYSQMFAMFDMPFLYGGPWSADDEKNNALVVVLSKTTNIRVFGGVNSVGQTLRLGGNNFQVIGVLDDWHPVPIFYDVSMGAFVDPKDVYMPFVLKAPLELPIGGGYNCWDQPDSDDYIGFLTSECVNNQLWVELPDEQAQLAYSDFLANYVHQQKALGRFPRPLNNRLLTVMQWLEHQQVVTDDAQIMLWLSFLFLFVCLLNTVALLLSKFTGKSGEIALRRAVGASRGDLFLQYLTETACIGLAGGLLGLVLAFFGLQGVKALYGEFADKLASLDMAMVLVALLLSLLASILAGLYPIWRACDHAPAAQLNSQ